MSDGIKKINEWLLKDGRTLIVTKDIDAKKLDGGTSYINYNTGVLQYVGLDSSGNKIWKKFNPMLIFNTGTVKSDLIADANITSAKLANDSVVTSKIKNAAVTEAKIENNAVTENKILNNAVTRIKISDASINDAKLASNAVTTAKIYNGAVTTEKIAPSAIINNNIANNTITNGKIANKTIDNTKIANKTIIESLLADQSVSNRALKDGDVTDIKIALNTISNSKLLNKTITAAKIANGTITTDQIASINASKLIDGSITEIKYKSGSVSNRVLANESVSTDKLNSQITDLLNRSIKVEKTQIIDSRTYGNTAWCKGSMVLKQAVADAKANLVVFGDITSTGTVSAKKCLNPVFADLAEAYVPVGDLKPGDPVALCLEGSLKVEKLNAKNKNRFLGFVSDEFATCYGASEEELKNKTKVPITLIGRININIPNQKGVIGDYVYIENGKLRIRSYHSFDAIGKLLENKVDENAKVLCQIWPC